MKKLLSIIAIAVAVPSLAMAQGTINFGTATANHVIQLNGTSVGAGFARVGLYAGSSANSLSLISFTQTLNFGAINGGTLIIPGVAGGTSGIFEVRAWTGGFATYEEAISLGNPQVHFAGLSGVFSNPTGNPAGSPPTTAQNLTGWTAPIGLVPVPEPSTIALGILGAGSLLFLRRKK